jgi:chemotaxis protein methyltransferase CheR
MTRTLAPADFELLREYLRRTAGLEFDEGRQAGLASIIDERLGVSGHPDVRTYVERLADPDSGAERQRLLDAVTIQETHFHRARPQIEALRTQILPDVLTRAAHAGREVVVWSAGCSTGEEPFTLAMLMLEVAQRMTNPPPMRVVGTDVSTAALQVAGAATYSGRTIDLAEPDAVDRWLVREADGTYVVKDEVRRLVEFAHHNLVTDPPPFPGRSVDLVVCRHVTIYFSRDTTRSLVSRFRDVLSPSGWLLMGPAESLWQVSDAFSLEAVGEAFAYRAAGDFSRARPPVRAARPGVGAAPATAPKRAMSPSHAAAAARLAQSSRPASPAPAARTAPATSRAPAPAARTPIDAAQAAFDTGAYAQAAELAAAVLTADPVSSPAYLLLGHSRLNQGDNEGAVEPLQRAVFLDPLAGHAHFLLAVALSAVGRTKQAAPAYRAAATTLPGVPPETVRRMLDGRRLQELVQLCRRLADEADGGADPIRRGA